MNDRTIQVLVSICCVTLLEAVAILKGVDGAYFGAVIAAISGLGGFAVGEKVAMRKKA